MHARKGGGTGGKSPLAKRRDSSPLGGRRPPKIYVVRASPTPLGLVTRWGISHSVPQAENFLSPSWENSSMLRSLVSWQKHAAAGFHKTSWRDILREICEDHHLLRVSGYAANSAFYVKSLRSMSLRRIFRGKTSPIFTQWNNWTVFRVSQTSSSFPSMKARHPCW